MGKKNIDVVKAWSRGYPASSHNGNFRTDGMGLWSYNLMIGATVAGEKVLALYRASGEYKSQTTSQHVASTLLRRPWTTHSTRPQHRPCDVPRLPGRSGLGGCDVAAFSSRGSADPIRVDWDEPRRRSGQGGRSRPAG